MYTTHFNMHCNFMDGLYGHLMLSIELRKRSMKGVYFAMIFGVL